MKNLSQILLGLLLVLALFTTCKKDNEINSDEPPVVNNTGNTGLVPATDEQLNQLQTAPPLSVGSLPKLVDLSSQMPPIGDQKNQGSCTSWATTYAVCSYFKHLKEFTNYVYEKNLMSPSYVYNQIVRGDCGGTSYPANFDVLINKGACSLEDLPYLDNTCAIRNNSSHDALAAKNKLMKFEKVNKNDLYNLKSILYSGLPIMIAIDVDASFDNLQPPYIWKNKSGASRGGHAIVIVGYDDNKGTGAFKVMNSWGKSWKDNGFLWIDYNFVSTAIIGNEAYIAYPANGGDTPPPTDQIVISLLGDLNFGQVKIGQSISKTLQIKCTGTKAMYVTSIACPNGFSGYYNGIINPNETKDIQITFAPTQAIAYNGTLSVNANFTGGSNQISISGIGQTADVSGGWLKVSGKAKDIGVGADNTVWIISDEVIDGGYKTYKWNGTSWDFIYGGGVRIAVDPQGNAVVVNSYGNIFKRQNNNWVQLVGTATDIGIGANGTMWITNTEIIDGGYKTCKWNGSAWEFIYGGAIRVAVDNNGNAWVVNSYGNIFRRSNNSWEMLSGLAKDIGVGADGTAWIISNEPIEGGYTIKKWNGSGWDKIEGGGIAISVDKFGKPWIVNSFGDIYKRN